MEGIGIGIITYYGLEDVQKAIDSIYANGGEKYHVVIFDNTEDQSIGDWVIANAPLVKYIHSPQNVGCSNARNRLAEVFAALGIRHFIIQDQDVEWLIDPVPEMLKVFTDYPDTGQVTVPLAIRQMQSADPDSWDESGLLKLPETPGMCCMYSLDCVAGIGGWEPTMFMFLFDTLFSLRANHAGYKIRTILNEGDVVKHERRGSGTGRYPLKIQEQMWSRRRFREVMEAEGIPAPSRFT